MIASRVGLACIVALSLLSPARAQPIIPGLAGFGVDTPAGSEGRIIRVTTLDNAGSGSLREALETDGPRVIIFEVGGVIDLDKHDLKITRPFVTIAGQTAPSPGISIIRGGMQIQSHDILIQHIRFRIGDAGMPKKSHFERDVSIEGPNAWNVIVDHCSFAWGTDENLSVSGPRYNGVEGTAHRVTLSSNIVAEGLNDGPHSKGPHSMGSLIHDFVRDVAVINSLYASNNERNPWFKGDASGVVVNNLIYNAGIWAIRVGANPKEWAGRNMPPNPRIAVVGNVMRGGRNTMDGLALLGTNTNNGDAWLSDNLAFDASGKPAAQTSGKITLLDKAPVWPAGLVARPAVQTQEFVLAHAGARPRDRDSVDERIVRDIRNGNGLIINSQDEVGGYPHPTPTQRKLDVPGKDVSAWLQKLAADLE